MSLCYALSPRASASSTSRQFRICRRTGPLHMRFRWGRTFFLDSICAQLYVWCKLVNGFAAIDQVKCVKRTTCKFSVIAWTNILIVVLTAFCSEYALAAAPSDNWIWTPPYYRETCKILNSETPAANLGCSAVSTSQYLELTVALGLLCSTSWAVGRWSEFSIFCEGARQHLKRAV
jgi:hypothetical protein